MAGTSSDSKTASNLLYGRMFDSNMILTTFIAATLVWAILTNEPELFYFILVLDLWFLGYHHVIATFSRIGFDKAARSQHKFELYQLPFIVLLGVIALTLAGGESFVITTYLLWQFYHYIRQSEGISKAYLGRSGMINFANKLSTRTLFYLLPTSAFVTTLAREHSHFLGMQLLKLPIPTWAPTVLWLSTALSVLYFVIDNRKDLAEGKLSKPYLAYLITHFLVFIFAYVVIADINIGWLGLNVWHNAQYLLFVWLANQKRFINGPTADAKLMSFLSQPSKWMYYLATFTGLTLVSYYFVERLIYATVPPESIFFATVIVYQTINFHHYVVDSRIWKFRTKKLQTEIGLKKSA